MRRSDSVLVDVALELDGLDVSAVFGGVPTAAYGTLRISARCIREPDGWHCSSVDPEEIDGLQLNDDESPELDARQMMALLDLCADRVGEKLAELAACGAGDELERQLEEAA